MAKIKNNKTNNTKSKNNNTDNNAIYSILAKEELTKIENMVQKFNKNKNMELEISFRNVNYANYMRISEHYVNLVDEKDISSSDSLDISIGL